MPAAYLLPAAHAHLQMALALDLTTVTGEMASLAATLLLFDVGRLADAAPYLDLAMRAAKALDDPELTTIVLAGRSFYCSYGGSTEQAARRGLEFAEVACEVAATGASQLTRAWAAAVASERHAALGHDAQCRRRLDDARAALDRAPGNDVRWSGIGAFTAEKLLAYEGGNMVRLGRYEAAAPVLDAALRRFGPTMRRHRCTALIDRAEARLGVADVDGACEDAEPALQLATDLQHAHSLRRIEALASRARASGAASAIRLWRDLLTSRIDVPSRLTTELT